MLELISFFVVAFFASFIGSMVGGAALITVPFLIFLGFPPQVAIATNKLGAVGLSLGATLKFWKAGKIHWEYVLPFSLLAVIGAYIGANILLSMSQDVLPKVIGAILLITLPLILFKENIGVKRMKTTKSRRLVGYMLFFFVLTFGGFFGGGGGTLMMYTLMIFFGFRIIESNATGIIPWLVMTLSSLAIFMMNGIVNYSVGLVMFVGMLIGGYLGAHTAIKKGDKWVKSLFVVVVLASAIKLLM